MKAMGKLSLWKILCRSYQNQAIIFTGDDMGSDKAMMIMLALYYNCDHGFCIWNYDQ